MIGKRLVKLINDSSQTTDDTAEEGEGDLRNRPFQTKMNIFLQSVFLLCCLCFHVTVAEQIIYAQTGEDATLNLPPLSSKLYFQWYLDKEEIAWLNPSGGKHPAFGTHRIPSHQSLQIRNLTQADFGNYTCTVKDKRTLKDQFSFKLIQLKVTVENPVLLPGESLSLTCDVGSQGSTTQIHWEGPHGQKENGGTLEVPADPSWHSGEWTCVVTNTDPEKRVTRKVTVIDLAPPAPVRTQYTSGLKPLTLPCALAADNTWDQVKSKGITQVGWNFCPLGPENNKSSLFLLSLEGDKLTWKTQTGQALRPSLKPSSGDFSLGGNLAREGNYECFAKFQNGVALHRTVRVEVLQMLFFTVNL